MPPVSGILLICTLIALFPSSTQELLTCVACETAPSADEPCNSRKSTCQGEYCVTSYYNPQVGRRQYIAKPSLVRGCLNVSLGLVSKRIEDHCKVDEDNKKVLCICSNKDKCNADMDKIAKKEEEEVKKVRCQCKGDHCKGKKTCEGDLCTYAINHKTNEITKGCMEQSLPLFERRAINSCMMPPMTGAMHHSSATTPFKELAHIEACVCATKDCNKEKPVTYSDEKAKLVDVEECQLSMTFKGNTVIPTTKKGKVLSTCKGEFCFRTNVAGGPGQLGDYSVEGCATFEKNSKMEPEFSSGECSEYSGEKLYVRTCYKAKDEKANKRLENSLTEPESAKKGEEEDEEEKEYVVEAEEETKSEGKSADNGKKESSEEKKEEEKVAKGEEKDSKGEVAEKVVEGAEAENKFIFITPTEGAIPDESNATMITIFVLIILCICVAGITWKFQLHRKLMRANYDTVAGG